MWSSATLALMWMLCLPSTAHKLKTITLKSLGDDVTTSCYMHPEHIRTVLHWISPNLVVVGVGDTHKSLQVSCTRSVLQLYNYALLRSSVKMLSFRSVLMDSTSPFTTQLAATWAITLALFIPSITRRCTRRRHSC